MSDTTDITSALRTAARAQLVGCEQPLVDMALRWVLHEFLSRTKLLKESFNVAMVPGQASYVLPVATPGGMVVTLLSAFNGTQPLTFTNFVGFSAPGAGEPQYAGMLDARTLRVFPTPPPGTNTTLSVLASVTVDPNFTVALNVPYVCQPYFNGLLSGVLARLYQMPDKPWSSIQQAGINDTVYRRETNRARIAAETGRALGAQMWRFPRFGR